MIFKNEKLQTMQDLSRPDLLNDDKYLLFCVEFNLLRKTHHTIKKNDTVPKKYACFFNVSIVLGITYIVES